MEFRSSSSIASLALLIASGGCALFIPATHAGERLEFSTPAFPLAVPHPALEIKESRKSINSAGAPGFMGGPDIVPQQEIIVTHNKHRDEDAWDSNPLLGEDKDKRTFDDWLTARPEPNPATNGSSSLNMPRGWDAKNPDDLFRRKSEDGFEAGHNNTSRFSAPLGFDAEKSRDGESGDRYARDADRYGRDPSNEKDSSSWIKMFNHDSQQRDQFNAARYTTFSDGSRNYDGGARDFGMSEPKPVADPEHNSTVPSNFETYTPFDNNQNRLGGEQAGQQFGTDQALRAWDQPPPANASRLFSRGNFNSSQTAPSRVVAPNRPVNLTFPKRPGDF